MRRLRPARGKNVSAGRAFDIFNNAQDHLLRAARSHLDGLVLDAFNRACEAQPDPAARSVMRQVCDLYALTVDRVRQGLVPRARPDSASRSKAVTAEVNRLCLGLRPHARALIDAFGIPESWIGAPIATGDEARRQDEAIARAQAGAGAQKG